MSLFDSIGFLNELQFNGQQLGDSSDNAVNNTDYTASDDSNIPQDNPTDAPESYTVPDQGEDQTPEEADQQNPQDQVTQQEDNQYNSQENDQPQDQGDQSSDGEDYTDEDNNYQDDDSNDDNEYNDVGVPNDDEIKKLEDELFSKFNDSQIQIMSSSLKKNYLKMYDMLDNIIERINSSSKEDAYIKLIEFVTNKMNELREMIDDYLVNTFNTKSYIENEINYRRFLIVLEQINKIISEIYPNKANKNKASEE